MKKNITFLIVIVSIVLLAFVVHLYKESRKKEISQNLYDSFTYSKPKYETLKLLIDDIKSDTLIAYRTILNEKGDTLEKEDIALRTVYGYNKFGNLIRENVYLTPTAIKYSLNEKSNPLVYTRNYFYDKRNSLVKKTLIDSDGNKVEETKFNHHGLIESKTNYSSPVDSIRTTFFYDKNGLLIKIDRDWLKEPILYEYVDNKLTKVSTYNSQNDLQNMYEYFYQDGLLVRKSYFNSWSNREDSTFLFVYNKDKIIKEITLANTSFDYSINKQDTIHLVTYKYDNRNNLIEKIVINYEWGFSKHKFTYAYDYQNRIINESEDIFMTGETFGKYTIKAKYKYYYKIYSQ